MNSIIVWRCWRRACSLASKRISTVVGTSWMVHWSSFHSLISSSLCRPLTVQRSSEFFGSSVCFEPFDLSGYSLWIYTFMSRLTKEPITEVTNSVLRSGFGLEQTRWHNSQSLIVFRQNIMHAVSVKYAVCIKTLRYRSIQLRLGLGIDVWLYVCMYHCIYVCIIVVCLFLGTLGAFSGCLYVCTIVAYILWLFVRIDVCMYGCMHAPRLLCACKGTRTMYRTRSIIV